jgi:hypothetical protein
MHRALHVALLGMLVVMYGCKVSEPNALERRTVETIKHHVTVGNKSVTIASRAMDSTDRAAECPLPTACPPRFLRWPRWRYRVTPTGS